MARALGPQQQFVLRLAERYRGEPVGYVADHLGVSERRARKVVQSLVERGLVIVVTDPEIGRRVWTPDAHWRWRLAQRRADQEREGARLHRKPMRTGLAE